ncbi:MAG: hypothetical protein CVU90_00510 [Firmicutes bacterium HGW-Firmicutes-15]|nr:MAG: hypothetical protein CVU90_00510 [Firmicutes bacterium HGW-Firmicutes-15]
MNQRLHAFDRLRVGATFAVIAIHITAAYVLVSPVAYFVNQWVRFAVPLFIIMSGFLLYNADLKTGFLPRAAFYRKRLGKILGPYLIWTLMYGSLNYLVSGAPHQLHLLIIFWAKHLLWGTAYYHLYFLVIILQLYVLYPFLRNQLKKRYIIWMVTSFILTFTTQIILYLNMMNLITLPVSYQSLYLVAFPGWIFYFMLGMSAALNQDTWEHFLREHEVLLGLVYLISLGILLLDSRVTSTYASSIRPSVVLYTVSSYFFFYAAALRSKTVLPSSVSWLSHQSFLIFLMHPLVLMILILMAPRLNRPDLWAGTLGMLWLYLATVAGTLFITYMASLTPLAALLGGTTPKAFQSK